MTYQRWKPAQIPGASVPITTLAIAPDDRHMYASDGKKIWIGTSNMRMKFLWLQRSNVVKLVQDAS